MTYGEERFDAPERSIIAQRFLLDKATFFLKRSANVNDASAKLDLLFASKAMTDAVRILQGKKVMK